MTIVNGVASSRAAIEIGPGTRPSAARKKHGEQIALPPRLWRLASSRLAGIVLLLPVAAAGGCEADSCLTFLTRA